MSAEIGINKESMKKAVNLWTSKELMRCKNIISLHCLWKVSAIRCWIFVVKACKVFFWFFTFISSLKKKVLSNKEVKVIGGGVKEGPIDFFFWRKGKRKSRNNLWWLQSCSIDSYQSRRKSTFVGSEFSSTREKNKRFQLSSHFLSFFLF